MRQRRRLRIGIAIVAGVVAVLIVMDRWRRGGWLGDDWSRFDNKSFLFADIEDGSDVAVQSDGGERTIVHLLGLRGFARAWDPRRAADIQKKLQGKSLTLHLNPNVARDDEGRILADAVTDDGGSISVELAAAGLARTDRNTTSMYAAAIERAADQARRRGLGYWDSRGSER
jgi:hypothetical protein